MKRAAFLALVLVVLGSAGASAWVEYNDGTYLPPFDDTPWWLDNNGGSISLGGGIITMSAAAEAWCDMGMWCGEGTGNPALPTMVAAARLKVDSMGESGMSLLLASTASTQPSTPLGFGILDNGNFALVDYSGGPAAGPNNPIVLRDLGPADNEYHSVYLFSAADGVWQAAFDDDFYAGVMSTNDWGEAVGYAEFAANTYWMNTRAVTTVFDWLAYGDETDMVSPPTMTIGQMKQQNSGELVVADEPKTVTYVSPDLLFCYIEEADRSSGIRVGLEGTIWLQAGDRVSVEGTIDTIDGEATVAASSVDIDATPGSIDPVGVGVRSLGGLQLGLQPDTPALDTRQTPATVTPTTLNTTGLLVRVAGKVFGSQANVGFYLEDGSPYGVWVDYTYGSVSDDAVVGITGVSSVTVDPTYGPVRQILTGPDSNLVVYKAP